ncbi:phage terminase large subunit [Streptomyces sp. NPDC006739]|uniref:phage terminase large subunit n=1 Tax=Streptomyces sp. NPDC006739 TaxID=3364763 RepID=UPI00368994CA
MTATLDWAEYAAREFEPASTHQRWATPGSLARHMDPNTVQTEALDLLDANLVDVAEGHCRRLIWSMPPQEGKSERTSRRFPTWLLTRNPELRIAIVSYEMGVARRWGRAIRNDITEHPELGLVVRQDTSAAHEWQLDGHRGGVYSVGIGGALTGRPVDVLLIDDPLKGRKEADSATYRQACKDFYTDTARTRLAPDALQIIIQTRWHEDDLSGWLLSGPSGSEWRYINVPAQAEDDNDPLGRRPGDYLISARGRTAADWEATKRDVGARTWAALYQGRPAPAEGGLFKRSHWRWYNAPRGVRHDDGTWWVHGADEVIQSWDMTFKDTRVSDFVVGQVWARYGADVFLLDQVRDRLDFPATAQAVRALSAKWPQSHGKLVEDKANGPAIIAQLKATVPGLIPVTPKDSKYARASSVAPFVESGNVHLPDPALAPWIDEFVVEHTSFPNSPHDDQVDCTSQALNRLLAGQAGAEQAMDYLRALQSATQPGSAA